jgi:nucleoside-diphosphate-sugar epimerase
VEELELRVRVLVTGHDGYIGSVLSPAFHEAGHDVVGLDTSFFADCVLGTAPPAITTVGGDIRDVTSDQLGGFDAVVHLAALSNDALGNLDPELTYEINHRASVQLARAAKEAGVRRFLFASSCSMYGTSGTDENVDESAPVRPLTPYAVSKVRAEEDLHDLADEDFTPVYLRNATAYGYSPRLRADIVLNNLVGWAHLTRRVRVLSDGTPWRPLVHVADITSAFLAALDADRADVHDQALNIGGLEPNLRVSEIAEIVAQTVPGCGVEVTGESGPDPRSYRVDFSKAERLLPGYQAKWSPRLGAAELHDAYVRYDLSLEAFERSYTRLPRLAQLLELEQLDHELRWREAEARVGEAVGGLPPPAR